MRAFCCRRWGRPASQEPLLPDCPPPPPPWCGPSASCSSLLCHLLPHHIGIITWGREGLACCEVGETGKCWNRSQYSKCAGLVGQTWTQAWLPNDLTR